MRFLPIRIKPNASVGSEKVAYHGKDHAPCTSAAGRNKSAATDNSAVNHGHKTDAAVSAATNLVGPPARHSGRAARTSTITAGTSRTWL